MSRKLPEQDYLVVNQKRSSSKSNKTNGIGMTTIIMVGQKNKKTYPTYIVDDFRNIKKWQPILDRPHDKFTVRFDPGWVTASGAVDADSTPYIVDSMLDKITGTRTSITSDIFTDSLIDQDTQDMIDIVKGLRLTYMQQPTTDTLQRLIRECDERIAGLENNTHISIWKDFYAKLDDNTSLGQINDESVFAVACRQNDELRNLLAKSVNVEIHLVDSVNNILNNTDDEIWFGHAQFTIRHEDYMLIQLGQAE